ncbi:MAG TPA: hypothetical protein PKD72_15480 [Gemmatales bacterium]|nr:hypothetical protein [Gemmatales bacterium]
MLTPRNYLVMYGSSGTLGYFVAEQPSARYKRGQHVLIRTDRGNESGLVLCEGHDTSLIENVHVVPGQIIRMMSSSQPSNTRVEKTQAYFEEARQWLQSLFQPMQLVDVEILEESETVVLQVILFAKVNLLELEKEFSQRWQTRVLFQNLTNIEALEETEQSDCGSCGSCSGKEGESSGCQAGSCGTGGCQSGNCHASGDGTRQFDADWRAYFAELRQSMDKKRE